MNSLMSLDPTCYRRWLDAWQQDFHLPPAIAFSVDELLSQPRQKRPELATVAAALREVRVDDIGAPHVSGMNRSPVELETRARELLDATVSLASPHRADRLFPADPAVYETNPLSIAHGSTGVCLALRGTGMGCPPEFDAWTAQRLREEGALPPGLYSGAGGVAWYRLQTGDLERGLAEAHDLMRHPLAYGAFDLFSGMAGIGCVQLLAYSVAGDPECLSSAVRLGNTIVSVARTNDPAGLYWTAESEVCCGLAHGASGAALFLLYLHAATGDPTYWNTGISAMRWVVSRALRNQDGGLTWKAKEAEPTHVPYWRWGSAGIGMVLLRYASAGAVGEFDEVLSRLFVDCDRKYSIFPGRFFGLAGIGEFLLDLREFRPEFPGVQDAIDRVIDGMLLFLVRVPGTPYVALPGEALSRVSCDFGTGSAGVALFLHRAATRGPAPLMLDCLLQRARAPWPCPRPDQLRFDGVVVQ
ncbi:MAG: lanthionine synthetase C family protein [Gemmatimonadaceae bacterium]